MGKTGFWQRVKEGAHISNFVIFNMKPTMNNNFAFDRKLYSTRRVIRHVRATVTDPAKRQAFDAWYSREHLPDALKSFGAAKAWRYWSLTDPSLHHAMYQFSDQAALDRAMDGPHLKRLVADFDRDWPGVTRTREALVLAEELGP